MQAFSQAKAKAAQGGGAEEAVKSMVRRGQMDVGEAYEVLNLDAGETDKAKIEAQYEKYFTANDPASGGSLYLQSKIFRAKEAIDAKLKEPEA